MNELNDYEIKTLKAFAEIVLSSFGGTEGLMGAASDALMTEEIQVLFETEELLLAWEADALESE